LVSNGLYLVTTTITRRIVAARLLNSMGVAAALDSGKLPGEHQPIVSQTPSFDIVVFPSGNADAVS
jgi:hypothetical protein